MDASLSIETAGDKQTYTKIGLHAPCECWFISKSGDRQSELHIYQHVGVFGGHELKHFNAPSIVLRPRGNQNLDMRIKELNVDLEIFGSSGGPARNFKNIRDVTLKCESQIASLHLNCLLDLMASPSAVEDISLGGGWARLEIHHKKIISVKQSEKGDWMLACSAPIRSPIENDFLEIALNYKLNVLAHASVNVPGGGVFREFTGMEGVPGDKKDDVLRELVARGYTVTSSS